MPLRSWFRRRSPPQPTAERTAEETQAAQQRRRRRWMIALGVLLVIRLALPGILRRVIVSQAEKNLNAKVEVGDVDLALYRAGVALDDVAVRLPSTPEAPPLVAWKRLDVELRWLPLFRKTVRLQHVVLDSPRVAIDRLADGQLNLLSLLPTAAQTPSPQPAPEATPAAKGSGWGFGFDRIVLNDGGVRFHDLSIENTEPIELNLEHIEVNDIALDQGVYGAPSKVHLALAFNQGSLDLTAYLTLRDDGTGVEAYLNAWGLPLQDARFYIPSVGWSAFEGSLDAALTYRLDTGRQHEVSGTLSVHDLAVYVPQIDGPALAWRNLTVRLDPLDLLAQRAAISDLELSGASLLLRVQGGVLLPLLGQSLKKAAAESAAATPGETPGANDTTPTPGIVPPSQTPEPTVTASPTTATMPTATPTATTETTPTTAAVATPASPTPEPTPWTWSLGSAKIDDLTVHLLGRDATLDIGVGLTVSGLAGDATYPAPVGLALTVGDGSVKFDGVVRPHSPALAGTLTVTDLSIPPILMSTTTLPTDMLSSGRLSTTLTVEAGMAVDEKEKLGARDARVRGHVTLADVQMKTPAASPLSIAAHALDLDLKDVRADSALPAMAGDAATANAENLAAGDVHLDAVLSLAEPSVAAADGNGLSFGARSVELTLGDITTAGVLPPAPDVPTRGDLHGGVHLTLADVHAAPGGPQGLTLATQSFDLGITDLSAQGLVASAPAATGDAAFREAKLVLAQVKVGGADPKSPAFGSSALELTLSDVKAGGVVPAKNMPTRGDLHAGVHLTVGDLHAAPTGADGASIDAKSLDLGLADLSAQGLMASAPTAPGDVGCREARLSLGQVKLGAGDAKAPTVGTRSLDLTLSNLTAGGVVPAAGLPSRGDVHAGVHLAIADVHAAAAGTQGFSMDTQSLDVSGGDVSALGLLAGNPPEIKVRDGRVAVAQLSLAGTDPKVFQVGLRSFDLPLSELSMPADARQAIRAVAGDVRLVAPNVQITRTTDGLLLPQFSGASSATGAAPPPSPPPSPAPAAAAAARPVDFKLGSFRLSDGKLIAVDRSVKPFFKGGLDPLNVDLRGLHWPPLVVEKIDVSGTGPEKGSLKAFGTLKPDEGWFEVYVDQLALPPYNPYAAAFSSYSIGSGALSLSTKGSRKGDQYYASNVVTLHDLGVQSQGGESLFLQQFGVPLEMALALMRDLSGNITLDIPVEADSQGTKVDVLSVVSGALRRAIVNALTSPLKLVGAVFSGSNGQAAAPAPIGFRPGRAEVDPDGSQRVDQLAAFMADRPGIGVTLDTSVTATDVRWLREQQLLKAWNDAGVLGALRGLTQRSARERVRDALEARAKDKPAELSAEDNAALDAWLNEQPEIPAERLVSLANERLARTEHALEEEHGLDAKRVKRSELKPDVTQDQPAVRVQLGSVGR